IPMEKSKKSIMIAEYPVFDKKNVYKTSKEKINLLKEINYNVRNIRGEMNVPPELKATVLIKTLNDRVSEVIKENIGVIKFLSKLENITYKEDIKKPDRSAFAVGSGYEIYLPLTGLIDFEKEKMRLTKELEKLKAEVGKSENKLGNNQFIDKAPSSVVEKERERLETCKKAYSRVSGILESLN
ncbi:MAG: class I tRNA ligase family protein, partial [Spirochaetes bacterium]|nr:class I tRNA ligase family protein [Spirochaetota bacterium]